MQWPRPQCPADSFLDISPAAVEVCINKDTLSQLSLPCLLFMCSFLSACLAEVCTFGVEPTLLV